MDPKSRVITLELDELDHLAILNAIARRRAFGVMPDGDSNIDGAAVAEICRGWMGMLDRSLTTKV